MTGPSSAVVGWQHGATTWTGETVGATGVPTLGLDDGFGNVAAAVSDHLQAGSGFVVVHGFPIESRETHRATRLFAGIMAELGSPLAQNVDGDLLYFVRAASIAADDVVDRAGARLDGSRGSGPLLFHTDQAAAPPNALPSVFGLLSLRAAASGGETRLARGHSLVNELLARDAALVQALSDPATFGRADDGVSDEPPVTARPVWVGPDGRARLRFNRHFMEVGARMVGQPLPPAVVAALDAADEVLERPGFAVELLLRPGEALFADNAVVLHNRRAYLDVGDQRRCLVRAWSG